MRIGVRIRRNTQLVARKPETLREVVETLTGEGIKAKGFAADAAEPASLIAAFMKIKNTLGAPNILLYNAAAMSQGGAFSLTTDTFAHEFNVNVAGALTAIQQVAPEMKQQKQGTILHYIITKL